MMIRQAAFAAGMPFLKGALHVHTTRSDGKCTPEAVFGLYKAAGYDFLALTDHNLIGCRDYAPEDGMIVLSGIERNLDLPGPAWDKAFCVHIVGVGEIGDPRTPAHDTPIPVFPKGEDSREAQKMIDEMRAWGFSTFYCHPQWSGTNYADFRDLDVDIGMEVWNTDCAMEFGQDTNAPYFDEALQDGKQWSGLAVDDAHSQEHYGKACVKVAPSEKSAKGILDALKAGAFYSSRGPEIYDFYVEDGKAHVECSRVLAIEFYSLRFPLPMALSDPEQTREITRGECAIPEGLKYVRASCVDAEGRRAWTNPIFLR